MISLGRTPKSVEEWFEIYGDPSSPESDGPSKSWMDENLAWFKLPLPLVLSWNLGKEIKYIYTHKLIGDAVVDGLTEIARSPGVDYVVREGHNRWGGSFNYRPQRGKPEFMSTHSFGAAFDINPHLGPLGGPNKQPIYIVETFVKRGFTWGGDWEGKRNDGMHFQAGIGL